MASRGNTQMNLGTQREAKHPGQGAQAGRGGWIMYRPRRNGDNGLEGAGKRRSEGVRLFSPEEWRNVTEHLELSVRQTEICRRILEGLSDKEMADSIGIALPTVRTHLRRLYEKLGVYDRTELVVQLFATHRLVS